MRVDPDGTSGSAAPSATTIQSSIAAANHMPKQPIQQLQFANGSTDQQTTFQFRLPADYATNGPAAVVLQWGCPVTSGIVVWKAGASVNLPGATAVPAAAYLNADDVMVAGPATVPQVVGWYKETSIALTMTGAVAGALLGLFIGRYASNGSDTAAGNANLQSLSFLYTTT